VLCLVMLLGRPLRRCSLSLPRPARALVHSPLFLLLQISSMSSY
jgi:hypothetical protein